MKVNKIDHEGLPTFEFFMDWFRLIKVNVVREFKSSMLRPLFFFVLAFYLFISGWLFFNYLASTPELTNLSLENSILRPFYANMNFVFMFLVPILTMKVYAEESKKRTLNLLLLSRLSKNQIVISKYISILMINCVFIALLTLFPLILSFSGNLNWDLVFSANLGLFLCCSFYSAAGIFFSSLTRNQVISALLSYVFLFSLMLFVFSAGATDNYVVSLILQYMSHLYHFEKMAIGLISNYGLVYFLSLITFFVVLTRFSLDSREW